MYFISSLLRRHSYRHKSQLVPSFRTLQKTLIGLAALSSSPSSSSKAICEAFQSTESGNSCPSTTSQSRQHTTTCSLSEKSTDSASMMLWNDFREEALQKAVLPLSEDSHKGSSGRVAILGGSARYTGAPYYAAMASLKAGADLAYIFTATEAALPIKSYSPELMVAPVYTASDFDLIVKQDELDSDRANSLVQEMVDQVVEELDRLHCLVVGPGLGRCPLVMKAVAQILLAARERNLHLVLDADALFMLSLPEYQSLLSGYDKAIVTPNIVEYNRLFPPNRDDPWKAVQDLKDVTVVRKGKVDVVMVVRDARELQQQPKHMTCSEMGGLKRSGGIGDVLAGTLGTTVAWHSILVHRGMATPNDLQLSCWTACCFVKRATCIAFQEKRRSMTAPDVLESLGVSIDQMTSYIEASEATLPNEI